MGVSSNEPESREQLSDKASDCSEEGAQDYHDRIAPSNTSNESADEDGADQGYVVGGGHLNAEREEEQRDRGNSEA